GRQYPVSRFPPTTLFRSLQLADVPGPPHEGQGDEIHVLLHRKGDVAPVLLGDRRQVDANPRQVDVAAALEDAAVQHLAAHGALFLGEHFEVDEAVVHGDAVADVDVVDDVLVVDQDGASLHVRLAARYHRDHVAG